MTDFYVGCAIVAALVIWAAWTWWPKADTNNDGKIDVKDAIANAKSSADVNKDGKVDVKDAVEVVKKVRAKKAPVTVAKNATIKSTNGVKKES
jgi:hypothetical protein